MVVMGMVVVVFSGGGIGDDSGGDGGCGDGADLSEVECPVEDLGHGGDDLGAPAGPGHPHHSTLAVRHDGRGHRGHWPLAW